MCRPGSLVLATLLVTALPAVAEGQGRPQPVQHELRLDGLFANQTAVHAGYGVSVPAGLYVRAGLVLGAGVGRHGLAGRRDLIGRLSFDPLRQSRRVLYGGADVSGRINLSEVSDAKAYLLFFLGVEGPLPDGRTRGWVPAIEIGLGGGARVGVLIRRGIHSRR